jgi:hypothetical protein
MRCFMLSLRLFFLVLASVAAGVPLAAAHAAATTGPISAYGAYNAPDEFDAKVARAFDTGPAASIDQLVKNLSLAIFQLSRHKIPKEPPKVYRVPHAELENYVCGTNCAIKAWYKPGEGIFLDESLQPETNVFHRSILLHELVHYFQDVSGYYGNSDACNRWFHRELDAYEVQNKYLGTIGHPSRVAYVGNNCSAMKAQGKEQDGILRTQVFSGGVRYPDTED